MIRAARFLILATLGICWFLPLYLFACLMQSLSMKAPVTPQNIKWAYWLAKRGEWRQFWFYFRFRCYKAFYYPIFLLCGPAMTRRKTKQAFSVQTEYPVASESPDHLIPQGTAHDNNSNCAFVLRIADLIERARPGCPHGILDLGCSGGRLVNDFLRIGWGAVGLEGSDYSLKHQRAFWPKLAGRNLFTCDITRPFTISPAEPFDVITAWDVIEHIHADDLGGLFDNVRRHLRRGGYFIASTASNSNIENGVDLHQTRWTNEQWRRFLYSYKWLQPADIGLRLFDNVKITYAERSFLVYAKI